MGLGQFNEDFQKLLQGVYWVRGYICNEVDHATLMEFLPEEGRRHGQTMWPRVLRLQKMEMKRRVLEFYYPEPRPQRKQVIRQFRRMAASEVEGKAEERVRQRTGTGKELDWQDSEAFHPKKTTPHPEERNEMAVGWQESPAYSKSMVIPPKHSRPGIVRHRIDPGAIGLSDPSEQGPLASPDSVAGNRCRTIEKSINAYLPRDYILSYESGMGGYDWDYIRLTSRVAPPPAGSLFLNFNHADPRITTTVVQGLYSQMNVDQVYIQGVRIAGPAVPTTYGDSIEVFLTGNGVTLCKMVADRIRSTCADCLKKEGVGAFGKKALNDVVGFAMLPKAPPADDWKMEYGWEDSFPNLMAIYLARGAMEAKGMNLEDFVSIVGMRMVTDDLDLKALYRLSPRTRHLTRIPALD